MCCRAPATTAVPAAASSRRASWFPIVPDGTYSAAGLPTRSAKASCKALTVGSSPYTSSPTSASAIALRISAVGRVTVSERRSTSTTGHATGRARQHGVDLDDLAAIAVSAATEAGQLLLQGLSHARTMVGTKSSATDMVTEMDRAAEGHILDRILQARPTDGVLGEEGGHASGTSGVRWIIDPLDGTTNYLYGYPAFGVSIAAEVDGEVSVGVVHDPARNETFRAVRGRGATCNGAPLAVAGPPTLATALVATGFSYVPVRRAWQAALLGYVLP